MLRRHELFQLINNNHYLSSINGNLISTNYVAKISATRIYLWVPGIADRFPGRRKCTAGA